VAHTKSQGAANRVVNVAGKRLGLKRAAGQFVNAGTIIIRQRGSAFHPGVNAGMGKDYTIFATAEGHVAFRNMSGHHRGQKYIDVVSAKPEQKAAKAAKAAKKAEPKDAASSKKK
jgi:large subunit ribosomal protein L27